jgi:hypothetical protein
MLEAAKLAAALAAREQNTSVWFLSDGRFAPVSDAVGKIDGTVHFVKKGDASQNQGVTALSLVPKEGSTQLFVQIMNAATVTQTRRLDLSVDDEPWTARSVTVGPGAATEVFVDDVPLGARVIQAALGGEDSLAADDSAWVVNRASVPGHVLLVTPGNKFLELALSLLPNVVLYTVAPDAYQPGALLDGQQPDVTIFDGGIPAALYENLPGGSLMLIAPPVSSSLVEVRGVATEPQITSGAQGGTPVVAAGQAAVDPLLRYADLGSAHISRAARIGLPEWARPLVMSDKGPLLVAGEQAGRKVVVSAFDFHDSDLPLQTSFPLLIRNLITYLLPPPAGGLASDVPSGSPVGIDAADASVDRIVVEDPSAKEWTAVLAADRRRTSFDNTTQPGVYYVTQYRGTEIVAQEAFAVNLLSRDESMTTPNDAPGLPAGLTSDEAGADSGIGFQRELWPVAVLAAIALLLMEWAYAQRMVIRRALTEWQTRRRLSRAGRA